MKSTRLLISLCLSILGSLLVVTNSTATATEPQVQLVSISSDVSTFYTDGRIRFTLVITRPEGSSYSDVARVWLCPAATWNGSSCTANQFLVSTTPTSTETRFVIESPFLLLPEGDYVVTGVSFRNAVLNTTNALFYPRAGTVTIGNLPTEIPLVDVTKADFRLSQEPEPEPEPIPEPEPETEPEPEPEPDQTQDVIPNEESPEPESTETGDVITQSESENAESNAIDQTSDVLPEPVVDDPVSESTDSSVESAAATPTNTAPATENVSVAPRVRSRNVRSDESVEQVSGAVSPDVVITQEIKPEAAEPISVVENQVIELPTIITTNEVVPISELKPNKSELKVIRSVNSTTGTVIKLTNPGKLEYQVPRGSGTVRLLRSNNPAKLIVKLGSKQLAKLDLQRQPNYLVNWEQDKPAKLKFILIGEAKPELLIDFLRLNGKLVSNPKFIVRK